MTEKAKVYKTREEYDQEDWERYRQKQREIFERKKAKFEHEGYKCKHEGCGKSFKGFMEYQEHINKHQEEMFNALICNQPNCGKQFKKKKDYFNHIEEHKASSKRKIINSIRAVLMYNKHGLAMDSFEREYRIMNGKPVPYKFLGYDSLYDLLVSIPDVVNVMQVTGGQFILIAVPDEKTAHVAKMVGNQRDNVEGFNRRTAALISQCGKDVKNKIQKATGIKDKQVSDYVKKQFIELLEDDENIDGILLEDLPTVYYKEFGYKIDYDEFGFNSLEEFCFHGLEEAVDMELDKFQWKIVEKGMLGNTMSINKGKEVSANLKSKIRSIFEGRTQGLTEEEFRNLFEEKFQPLNFRDFSTKSLLEFACNVPDLIKVDVSPSGSYKFYPVSDSEDKNCGSTALAEVSENIKQLLEGHTEGVLLGSFISGYEGYYGSLNEKVSQLKCGDIVSLLVQCDKVCQVTRKYGKVIVSPVRAQPTIDTTIATRILGVLHEILSKCDGGRLHLNKLPQIYREVTGHNMDYLQLGFSSLKSLVENLVANHELLAVKGDSVKIKSTATKSSEVAEKVQNFCQKLESGWVRIVTSRRPDLLCFQLENVKSKLKELETNMDAFYTWDIKGRKIKTQQVSAGMMVAALYTDMIWHRARIVSTQNIIEGLSDKVEVEYVDWGWHALVRIDVIRVLETQFQSLPHQCIKMKCNEMQLMGGVNWPAAVAEGRGRGRVQFASSGDVSVELFTRKSPSFRPLPSDDDQMALKIRDLIFGQLRLLRKEVK